MHLRLRPSTPRSALAAAIATALTAASALAQQTPPAAAAPSPVARVVISPANPTVVAGDSIQLTAQALDAAGRPVPGAIIRFLQGGSARFEGSVDTLGLVRAGATGTMNVTVAALVPGTRPVIERVDVRMVPGPLARIEFSPRLPTRMVVGQQLTIDASAYSAGGDRRTDRLSWRTTTPAVLRVSPDGLVSAVGPGRGSLVASAPGSTPLASGAFNSRTALVEVVPNTLRRLDISPAAPQVRTGDVVRFTASPRDAAGSVVAGLKPSWSFAPGQGMIDQDGGFVAYEAGKYTVTATLGSQVAQATITVAPRDVRRAATVLGRLPRTRFTTEEVWLHPNGRNAYLGSGGGGDVLYALDISDPTKPAVTDSLVVNTRRVNDVMTTPDGRFLVFTREGASDRRNGVVFASLEDPAHPKIISEFTDGVTAGVHSSFIYRQEKYGTHVYLTNDGTGALHILDISDPYKPREVAQWKTPRSDAGRSLHDIDVQDGLLYASYWNDGLVILDIGNGVKGGSPSNPQLVSQFKYDLNDLYRQVEAVGGPGFIRGTHTAWRHKNYVFIADEVFPATGVEGAKDAAAGRAYGRLQVIDVSDMAQPKSVAFYEPEFGGVHNLWVAGDTLYMGAYNAGFRAFDISGELKGDLRAQQREMVHVNTADMDGRVSNTAMTWGVVVRNGIAYVNDMYNGLWVIRMEPKKSVIVP